MGASEQPPNGSIEADLVVKIAEAKSRLSELIRRAESGERVVISRGATADGDEEPRALVFDTAEHVIH